MSSIPSNQRHHNSKTPSTGRPSASPVAVGWPLATGFAATMPLIRRASLWIFYGLLAYMPLHIFLSTWLGTSLDILDFAKTDFLQIAKVIKDAVLIVGFLFAFCASLTKPWFKKLLRDRLVWLIAVYALLTIFLAFIKPTDSDAEVLGVLYNLRFLLFFLYGILLTHLFDPKQLRTTAIKIVLAVGVFVVVFGVVQYMILPDDALEHVGYFRGNGVLPAFFIDDKPDLERVMSTLRDPNSLGSYLIIVGPLAALACFRQKDKQKKAALAFLVLLTTICVYLTFSRSAWIGFVLAMASFVILGSQFKQILIKYKRPLAIGVIASVLVGLGGLYVARDSYFVQNTILHADESTVLEDPNELRVRFFRESIEEIADEPLGGGPGTAGLASIRNNVQGTRLNENYYLQIASEVGVFGLLLFLMIIGVVGLRLFRAHKNNPAVTALLASFIGLALTNFLVHIWSNEAVAYTWWGLAGVFFGAKHLKNLSPNSSPGPKSPASGHNPS